MNIFKYLWCWFWMACGPMYFSSSKAKTESKTENIDQRLLQEAGAIGATSSGGGTSIVTMLDGGAIKEAFGLGNHAIDNVTDFATGALSGAQHTAEQAMEGQLSTIKGVKDAYDKGLKEVSTAYEDAKIGNRSIMTAGALLLGGVAIIAVMGKRA